MQMVKFDLFAIGIFNNCSGDWDEVRDFDFSTLHCEILFNSMNVV